MSLMTKLGIGGLAVALSLGSVATVADAHGLGGHHKHPANHGATVSAVAKSDATEGEAHGDAVSAAARSDTDTSVDRDEHGDAISMLAQTTASGSSKGATISDAASAHGQKMSGRSK